MWTTLSLMLVLMLGLWQAWRWLQVPGSELTPRQPDYQAMEENGDEIYIQHKDLKDTVNL